MNVKREGTADPVPAGRRLALAAIALGTMLGPLDSSVNIAFPDITRDFALPLPAIRWVVIPYVVTYACLMLVFGRLGDLVGHRRIFRLGLGVSAIAFALCALSPGYAWLIGFRILQGVGTAMVLSCGPALATALYDEALRPRILGHYATGFALGAALGPLVGGALVDLWGWPAVFWFRLPLALVAVVLSGLGPRAMLPADQGRFDLPTAALLAAASALILVAAGQIPALLDRPVLASGVLAAVVLAAVLLLWFGFRAARRRRRAGPADGAVARPGFVADLIIVNATNVAVNCAGFAVMLLVPYFLARTGTLAFGGAVLATGPLGMMLAAQAGGRLAPGLGANRLAFLAAVFVALGLFAVSHWPADAALWLMIPCLMLHGAGLGLFQVTSLEMVTGALPRAQRGVAGSLVLAMRTVGVVLAASLLTLLFVTAGGGAGDSGGAFLEAFRVTFRWAAVALAGFLALTWLRPGVWLRRW